MRANSSVALSLGMGVVLLFLSMLYPPWVASTRNLYGGITELPCGYEFLFTQPAPETPNISIKIDFAGLFVEWTVILLGTALCVLLARRRESGGSGDSGTEEGDNERAPDASTASRSQAPGARDS